MTGGDIIKRALDIVGALVALCLLSPLILVVAVLVRVRLGSPVLFRQARAGLHGAEFTFYKFRTMTDARDPDGTLLPDAARLTPLGRRLRGSTLDELPSLWNVLKGEMSLVGPRPLYPDYTALYSPEQARRLDVKPGLTGWAVIHGRNALGWDEKFRLDVWYVDHRSLGLDLRILLKTGLIILSRKGVSRQGHATMPRFTGHGDAGDGKGAP